MDKRLSIKTYMEKEDYRKFLYTITLFKSVKSIAILVGIALIAAILLTVDGNGFNVIKLLKYFILLLIVASISIVLKIEKLNKSRIKNNKELFNSANNLEFYDEHIKVKNDAFEEESIIPYDTIFKVSETKDFYLIYLNNNQASVIRKKDINSDKEISLKRIFEEKLSEKTLKLK